MTRKGIINYQVLWDNMKECSVKVGRVAIRPVDNFRNLGISHSPSRFIRCQAFANHRMAGRNHIIGCCHPTDEQVHHSRNGSKG